MKKFLDLFKGKSSKPIKKSVETKTTPQAKDNVLAFEKKPKEQVAHNVEDKRVIELLQKKITQKMKENPQMQKKAAQIVSEMLNKKASGKD